MSIQAMSSFSDTSSTNGLVQDRPPAEWPQFDQFRSFQAAAQATDGPVQEPTTLEDAQLYDLLVKRVTDQAIFLADLEGRIRSWNSGVLRILGYAEQEFVGQNLALLFDDAERRNGVPQMLIHAAIREGNTSETRWHLRSDGSHIYSSRVFTVVRDESGCPSGLAILLQDATGQKQNEDKRQKLNDSLQQSNEDLSRLGHILSHDLRTPLRMIGTYIAMLAKELDGQLDETSRECMSYVLQGVDYMDHLVKSVVSYAQAENTQVAVVAVDLELVLQRISAILNSELIENEGLITHDPLPIIQGDSVLLLELFQNLIANALKYRSMAAPHIHISARETSANWTISIRDNGIGIDACYAEQIFLPLTRLHGSQIAGSGIGLAICKRIMERHGGQIWVESAIGCGSNFSFSFPRCC